MFDLTIFLTLIIYLAILTQIYDYDCYKLTQENKKLKRIIKEINENIEDEGM